MLNAWNGGLMKSAAPLVMAVTQRNLPPVHRRRKWKRLCSKEWKLKKIYINLDTVLWMKGRMKKNSSIVDVKEVEKEITMRFHYFTSQWKSLFVSLCRRQSREFKLLIVVALCNLTRKNLTRWLIRTGCVAMRGQTQGQRLDGFFSLSFLFSNDCL